ncbi:hypothetical protein ACOME3_005300 [Neoechinorhynchus agilis]
MVATEINRRLIRERSTFRFPSRSLWDNRCNDTVRTRAFKIFERPIFCRSFTKIGYQVIKTRNLIPSIKDMIEGGVSLAILDLKSERFSFHLIKNAINENAAYIYGYPVVPIGAEIRAKMEMPTNYGTKRSTFKKIEFAGGQEF